MSIAEENAVELCGVYKLFPSEEEGKKYLVALEDISLEIKKGSLAIVAGANGSGKSVLMQIISGLMPCFSAQSR